MAFHLLGLSETLLRALVTRGYETPTAVQSAVIPEVLKGLDVWATASTGSGKTAAFALPLLKQFEDADASRRPRPVRFLVLAPTRELALQIAESFESYGQFLETKPKTVVVLGGVSINPQMMALRGGADIVIATPGRLLDLVEKNALSLSQVQTLVLDEADRLLDQGFAEELQRILLLLPRERQTLLFSATFAPPIEKLAGSLLTNPFRVDVTDTVSEKPKVVQRAIEVDQPRRTQLLRHLLEVHAFDRTLVFVATTYATEHVSQKLRGLGIAAAPLHGKLSQGARTDALRDFREGRIRVLVATDLAARGLDITGLPAVVNYDLPRSPNEYVHRIGRTGRAGEPGMAISFITAESYTHFKLIEKRCELTVVREWIAGFDPVQEPILYPEDSSQGHMFPSRDSGGIKGKRKSKKDKLREAQARSK